MKILANIFRTSPSDDLRFMFQTVLHYTHFAYCAYIKEISIQILFAFKSQVGENDWQSFVNEFPPALRQRLFSQYQI